MRLSACLATLSFAVAFTAGCASTEEDDSAASSSEALTSLTAAQCKTPTVKTTPQAAPSGGAIPGSAHTTLSGCVSSGIEHRKNHVETRCVPAHRRAARRA